MPSPPPARHLLRAKDLVDVRFAEPLTVDDMAAAAGALAGTLLPRVRRDVR